MMTIHQKHFLLSVLKPFHLLMSIFLILPATAWSEGASPSGLSRSGMVNTLAFAIYDQIYDFDYKKVTLPAPESYRKIHPQSQFHYTYKSSSKSDGIVFIIPGFGGLNDQGVNTYLMTLLHQQGLTAVVIDSPASARFIAESSYYGVPGIPETDSQDIEEVFFQFKKWMEKKRGRPFAKSTVIGTSLGGYNVVNLFLRRDLSKIRFDKYISISAPISNLYGLDQINQMMNEYLLSVEGQEPIPSIFSVLFDALIGVKPLRLIGLDQVQESVHSLQDEARISKQDARILVGRSFSSILERAKRAFWARYINDPHISAPKSFKTVKNFTDFLHGISLGCGLSSSEISRGPLLALERTRLEFKDTRRQLQEVPLRRGFASLCESSKQKAADVIEGSSILNNLEELRSDAFVAIGWEDDFLVNEEHLQKAKKADLQLHVLKNGGHLGGFYQTGFQNLLIQLLSESN